MKFVILLIMLIAVSQGQYLHMSWMDNLMASINQLNRNIQSDVQNLNQQIQNSVKQSMLDVDSYYQTVAERLKAIQIPTALDALNSGQQVVMNSGTGSSKFVLSGHHPNGQPYYRDIEQVVTNNVLKHIEKIYNYTTQKYEKFGYTLDLNDPSSKPVPIPV